MIANTPKPPYYAVIFTTYRTDNEEGYNEMAKKMEELAATQEGFLGIESARNDVGITVSYWKNLDAILKWKNNPAHTIARKLGKELWYEKYQVRICKVEHAYGFEI